MGDPKDPFKRLTQLTVAQLGRIYFKINKNLYFSQPIIIIFNPPDPDNFTSLTEFFEYDDILARSTPVPRIPPIPPRHRKSGEDISLDHLICEEEFV